MDVEPKHLYEDRYKWRRIFITNRSATGLHLEPMTGTLEITHSLRKYNGFVVTTVFSTPTSGPPITREDASRKSSAVIASEDVSARGHYYQCC